MSRCEEYLFYVDGNAIREVHEGFLAGPVAGVTTGPARSSPPADEHPFLECREVGRAPRGPRPFPTAVAASAELCTLDRMPRVLLDPTTRRSRWAVPVCLFVLSVVAIGLTCGSGGWTLDNAVLGLFLGTLATILIASLLF